MPLRKKISAKKVASGRKTPAGSKPALAASSMVLIREAVPVHTECTDGAAILADLLKNLHTDCYSEDEAELQFLYSKPSCFLILGKPGVGKTLLARRFAAEWKCLVVNSTDVILENMELQTEMGLKCVDILTRGGAVTDEMVLKMIEDKVNSSEVTHHGYVMDDFPCLSEDILTIDDQLELIKSWKLKPDFVVNLKIPEKDIEKRRCEQKIDPFTGVIYTKEVYASDKPLHSPVKKTVVKKKAVVQEKAASESGEEAADQEEEIVEEEQVIEENESGTENPTAEIVQRLVVRPEDMPAQVEQNLAKYRSNMLQCLEDYMGDHDQQFLLELDGNLPNISLFKQLMQKLQTLVLHPAAVVTRLTDLNEDDFSEDMDTDDLMRALNSKQIVGTRYRWRRSKWLRNCPVALYEGNVIPGKPEFAVSFLDKVYCLSNPAALIKFMRNPRPYLVPRQPKTPCKISIVGQPFSGKSTLCQLLSQHYNAKIFDIHTLARKHKLEDKMKDIEQVKIDSTAKAIEQVKNRIRKKLEAERQRQERDRRAILDAQNEALRMEEERYNLNEDEDGDSDVNKTKIRFAEGEQDERVYESMQSVTVAEDEAISGDSKKESPEVSKSDSDKPKEDESKMDQEGERRFSHGAADDTLRGPSRLFDGSFEAATEGQSLFDSKTVSFAEIIAELQQVDASHPEVRAIVAIEVSKAKIIPIKVSPEYMAELLEKAIQEWEVELRNTRHDGPLQGCWILDNFPETAEQWNACFERNVIPDTVYVLGDEMKTLDSEKMRSTVERYCLKNKDFFYTEMGRREVEKELDKQKAELAAQQKQYIEEEKHKKALHEELERQRIINEELRVAEAARQEARAQLQVNQVLWDTLAGELQTGVTFQEMGFMQPRGPSFISTLSAEFRDYSELYAALDVIQKKKGTLPKKYADRDRDATTADTIPHDEDDSFQATPVQVPSTVLDNEEDGDSAMDIAHKPREKTELDILMEQPEAKMFMEKLLTFEVIMASLESAITASSSIIPHRIKIEGFTPEQVLSTVIKIEERPYQYVAWEVEQVDLDEMEEDNETESVQTEGHEQTTDRKHGVEEEEDPNRGMKKFLGESNYFDPVNLKEGNMLFPGNSELAAMYRERMYYFSSEENRERFIQSPKDFLLEDKPMKPPPLRLLVLGPTGAGKSEHSSYLSEKLGIFHISFKNLLQEMIIAKTKRKIGPEFEEDYDESAVDDSESPHEFTSAEKFDNSHTGDRGSAQQSKTKFEHSPESEDDDYSDESDGDASQDDEGSSSHVSEEGENVSGSKLSIEHSESENLEHRDELVNFQDQSDSVEKVEVSSSRYTSKQALDAIIKEEEEELELTEDEEAIKANLESNEPLSLELLEKILKPFWSMEPYKSTGFIMEGFPRTAEEARFMQEFGLFTDAAISMQATEKDISGRLLPPKISTWKERREKRLSMKARQKARSHAKRTASIARRREVLTKERDVKRALKKRESFKSEMPDEVDDAEDEEEEIEEEEEEDIEAILAEEFEEEEEEQDEEEEREEEAVERMKNDISETFADENDRLSGVVETLEEIQIPCLNVPAGRKLHIVRYIINKNIKAFVEFRGSMFERVYPVSENLARSLLQVGYKQPSRFGRWDPVQLKEGNCIQPMRGPNNSAFACIYRSYIYYLANQNNRISFMQDPLKYLNQEYPKSVVPLKIAIIGPPKSGKTTLANRFVEDYGVMRLSIGEALRYVLAQHPKSELAQNIKWNLVRGRVVPDELQVLALDVALLDVRCQTRGYVLDGYPMTLRQVELMTQQCIIPVKVIELELSSKEVLMRGVKDRMSSTRTMALHDSTQVLAIKLSCYQRFVPEVREWYQKQHQNHHIVPADQSKWWVLDVVHDISISSVKRIQDYLKRTSEGRSAGIAGLCITPQEFQDRLGNFSQYCPVSLAEWNYLVDCSLVESLEFAAEFRGHYYKMAGSKELEMFLTNPEKYVLPLAPFKLPEPEELPQRISREEIGERSPEIMGYCPVTYLDGNMRYEALIPGNPDFAVEYKGKVYLMENEQKLIKFMREPEKYANLTLPHKLPPAPEDMPLPSLPMLGFMEQTCAIAMIKALTAAGNVKPKYPFISSTRSALIYIAYHLKAFNPKSSPYIRKKYKQKLQQFQETCELIKYLGNNMTVRYRDPNERPKDFDNKLETFFALRGIEPTPTWLK